MLKSYNDENLKPFVFFYVYNVIIFNIILFIYEMYVHRMSTFKLKINYGGRFVKKPGYHYAEGQVEVIDGVDGDWLNVDKVNNLSKKFGYQKYTAIYFRKGKMSLLVSLELICDDESIRLLVNEGMEKGVVELYCDHSLDEVLLIDKDVEKEGEEVDCQVDAPIKDNDDEEDEEEEEEEEKTDIELSEASDDDQNVELIDVRFRRGEIVQEKLKEIEVVCEVQLDNEVGIQTEKVPVEEITGEEPAEEIRESTSLHNKKVRKKPSRLCQSKAPEAKDDVEPTFSSDEDVITKFGKRGMKPWVKIYENSDVDIPASPLSSSGSEWEGEEPKLKEKVIYPIYNPNTPIKDIKFELYMIFTGVEQLREAIQNYALGKSKGIRFPVNEPTRIQAKCAAGCPWSLWASYVPRESYFQITL